VDGGMFAVALIQERYENYDILLDAHSNLIKNCNTFVFFTQGNI
jgi:hypothetical protein